jgi:RHS repeat-associated protein
VVFFPLYDSNGNITAYLDESGTIVASYTYDAFGRTIAQSGPLASAFPHRFSTKYHDPETGHYYYGYRFYSPDLMRWMNRDSIEEAGGNNLYAFIRNNVLADIDPHGMKAFFSGIIRHFWFAYDQHMTKLTHAEAQQLVRANIRDRSLAAASGSESYGGPLQKGPLGVVNMGHYQGYEAVRRLLQDSDSETLVFTHANSTKLVLNYPGSGMESEELSLRSLQRFKPEDIKLNKLTAWGCSFAEGADAPKIRAKLGKPLWAMPIQSTALFDVYLADKHGNLVTNDEWNKQFRTIFRKHAMSEALFSQALVTALTMEWKAKLQEARVKTDGEICSAFWDVYYQDASLLEEVHPAP